MTTAYNQSASYIPSTDAGFRDWLANFSGLISADPVRYGLEQSDATIIANLNTSYGNAYQVVQAPTTRTPNAVAQKDAIKASAIASVRVYAMLIKSNVGVDNNDKISLGIHVDDTTPTPIPAPSSSPLLSIVAAFSGEHIIRYADENTPASRRKPDGAIQIQINRIVAAGAVPLPDGSEMVGLYTKQPISVPQNQADVGKTATYFARWVTRKGLFGPWSLPVCMTIAFGGPVEQQMFIPDGGTTATGDGENVKIAA